MPVCAGNKLLAAVPVVQEAGPVHHEHGLLMRLLIQRLRCDSGSAALPHSRPRHVAVQGLEGAQTDLRTAASGWQRGLSFLLPGKLAASTTYMACSRMHAFTEDWMGRDGVPEKRKPADTKLWEPHLDQRFR